MANAPLWITEADVVALMPLAEAVGALERILRLEAAGQAANMPKAHLMVGANDAMHAIGGAVAGAGICGTKTWVNVGGKSQTVLVLFSLEDGSLRAVIEATALGQTRTAAMTGLGTKILAPEDADELTVIGSGKQALPQAAAVAAVRKLRRVRVYSRRADAREAFAASRAAGAGARVRGEPDPRGGRQGCADRHPHHQRAGAVLHRRHGGARQSHQRDGRDRAGAGRVRAGHISALRRHRGRYARRGARAFV